MNPNDVAVRKRSQIAKANRTMFLWIAAASALVGVAAVVGLFLGQQLFYNEKVLAEKQKTSSTLKQDLSAITQLKQEILVLDTNPDLAKVRANPNDNAIQVILDALPSEPNALALGASLQNKLLVGIPGLKGIESLVVNSVNTGDQTVVDNSKKTTTDNAIDFSFTISGTQPALQQLLTNLERSIRTIEFVSVRFETQQNGELLLNVSARAFYEPTRTLELKNKVVPR